MKRTDAALLFVAMLIPANALAVAVPAQAREVPPELLDLAAFTVGSRLAYAGLSVSTGRSGNEQFEAAREMAEAIEVPITFRLTAPSSPGQSYSPDNGAEALGFLLRDVGQYAQQVGQFFSSGRLQSLIEFNTQAIAIVIIYSGLPDQELDDSLQQGLENHAIRAGLPNRLWMGVVTKMAEDADQAVVRRDAIAMLEESQRYLEQRAR